MVEKLDDVFHTSDELKQQLRFPLLGVIPHYPELATVPISIFGLPAKSASATSNVGIEAHQHLSLTSYDAFYFLEAFRTLYTSLKLLSADQPLRSLVITSALPSDGKSTVALHLALAAAVMGQRVLLVDADLRCPQIHRKTNLSNLRGLSNIITANANIGECIQHLPDENNLLVLTAGQIPPDPTRLLSSQKFQHLMQGLKSHFDLVIYDAPPTLGFADSMLLSSHADGCILVVGVGQTGRPAFSEALHYLETANVQILGLVANCLKAGTMYDFPYKSYYNRYYDPRRSPSPEEMELKET